MLVRLVNQVLATAGQSGTHSASWDDGACANADPAHGELTVELFLDPVTPVQAAAMLAAARTAWSQDRYTVTSGRFETDPAYASAPDDQVTATNGSYRLSASSVDDTSIWLKATSCYTEAAPPTSTQSIAMLPAPATGTG